MVFKNKDWYKFLGKQSFSTLKFKMYIAFEPAFSHLRMHYTELLILYCS